MLSKIGGRKLAISALVLVVCLGMVAIKGDVPPGMADMLKYILGVFIGGNVLADVASARARVAPVSKDETGEKVLAGVNACQQALGAIIARITPNQ